MLHWLPLPSWDAMHPLLIHFPIVLLLFAPLFVVIAAAMPPPRNRPYMTVALITLLIGAGSLFLAASSGEEAAELADRTGGVNAVLATHEAMASTCEVLFAAFSAIFAGLYVWPRLSRRIERRMTSTVAPLVFVALYSVGLVYLVNTAHAGGRLVHEFGVHAMMPQDRGPTPAHSAPAAPEQREGD
jgi:uncharacterized membrane protein